MKNWKKLTAAALTALALVGTLAGCGNNADKKPDTKQATKIVTDLKGREVSVPQDVKRIAVVPFLGLVLFMLLMAALSVWQQFMPEQCQLIQVSFWKQRISISHS